MDVGPKKSAGAALLFSLLCATLGHQLRFIPQISARIEETFEKRMEQIIDFVAFGTKNGYFEQVLRKLKDPDLGNIKWAVAKFISYKLNMHFDSINGIEVENVPITEYSNLLAELIKECNSSVYFTCPYHPREWFIKLDIDPCKACKEGNSCKVDIKGNFMPKGHMPIHFQIFCDSSAKDKKRVVNLSGEQWKGLLKNENAKCFQNLIRYVEADKIVDIVNDKGIELVFVKQEDLKARWGEEMKDIVEDDYNILDDKVVMMWDADLKKDPKGAIGTCKLIFDRGLIERYKRVFQNIEESSFKTPTEIQNMIEKT